jgi:hypothetical protein
MLLPSLVDKAFGEDVRNGLLERTGRGDEDLLRGERGSNFRNHLPFGGCPVGSILAGARYLADAQPAATQISRSWRPSNKNQAAVAMT